MIDEKKLILFEKILNEFNKIHSLTNYTNIKAVMKDSLEPLKYLNFTPKIAIDVGSGAGFPGIFLAIELNECEWSLFEPNPKKAAFLTYAKLALNLKNVKIYRSKIQNSNKFRADLITSRALMKTKDLIKICKGFYDEKTEFLLYKGSSVFEEIDGLNAQIINENHRNYILIKGIK
ncbi:MAG: 16S rRNA (guanine(527)-N(7))-methyltransferase RsmG [Campylobacter sp.]|nr:16S rRNA (guanine(527)-N(7))-methyltransferase RsmG [Campylobacter sp.]